MPKRDCERNEYYIQMLHIMQDAGIGLFRNSIIKRL